MDLCWIFDDEEKNIRRQRRRRIKRERERVTAFVVALSSREVFLSVREERERV